MSSDNERPVRRYFYDTEFIEYGYGHPIHLIAIGVVDNTDRQYYAINADMPQELVRSRPFLAHHVWPLLPRVPSRSHPSGELDRTHPDVKPIGLIAAELRAFLLGDLSELERVELWADYAGYDHVVLAQVFGTMSNWPYPLPMFTRDVQQEAARLGVNPDTLPEADEVGLPDHHALHDAITCRMRWERLTAVHDAQVARLAAQAAATAVHGLPAVTAQTPVGRHPA